MQIIFHVGLTKTGSTAIQKLLLANKAVLKKNGYLYSENAEENTNERESNFTSSGNGYSLFLNLINSSTAEDSGSMTFLWLQNQIEMAKKEECEKIIISTEAFCTLKENKWTHLINGIKKTECDCLFILFNRDPYDWAFSSWLQVVKREGHNRWFTETIETDTENTLYPLKTENMLRKFLPEGKLKIISYEENKQSIEASFLLAAGFTQLADIRFSNSVTNKSLTRSEFITSYFSNKFTQKNTDLSEQLFLQIPKNKDGAPIIFFSPKSKAIIEQYCSEHGIKKTTDETQKSSVINTEVEFIATLTRDELIYATAIKILAEYATHASGKTRRLALHKVDFYKNSEYKKLVPENFNLFSYLLLNEDVLFEPIDPYKHYVEYGVKEARRFFINN